MPEQHVERGVVGGETGMATAGRVLEAHIGDLAHEIWSQAPHDGSGEPKVLLERPEQVEHQRLAGQQVIPEPLDVTAPTSR